METKATLCKNCANLRPEFVWTEWRDCLAYPGSDKDLVTGKQEFRLCRDVRKHTEKLPICSKFRPATFWTRLRNLI